MLCTQGSKRFVDGAWEQVSSGQGQQDFIVAFRSEPVIFSALGLILYSDHDLIPCMDSARLSRCRPDLAGGAS